MDIVIGKVPDNLGSVGAVKDFCLSNELVHVSFGAANPRGGGEGDSVAAANIILQSVDLHLRVFGDEVAQFRSCVTPTEVLRKAYSAIVANVDADQLHQVFEFIITRSYANGKKSGIEQYQSQLRTLAGLAD